MSGTDIYPDPPVPADADLSDFKFMPLEVARLRRSKAWLICKRRPELAFYMLNLWTASWHERPAGSLEDDDDVLADAAMCPPERWGKVRGDAMRGWVKCSDGRLYHPVVAEKVSDSYHTKVVARWSKECDRIRKENHRRKESDLPALDFPPRPERNDTGIPSPIRKTSAGSPPECEPPSAGIPSENALKGREGKGTEGKGDSSEANASGGKPPPTGKDLIFGEWLAWLIERTERPRKDCASQLGKWRKLFGDDDALIAALSRAKAGAIQEPMAWMEEAAKAHRAGIGLPPPKTPEEARAQLAADPNWSGVMI